MATKKENKEDKKIIKPATITKKEKKPAIKKQKIVINKKTEEQFFAKDLADKMGISSFEFLLIKREAGIEDGSPITRSKMQKLYSKIIKG